MTESELVLLLNSATAEATSGPGPAKESARAALAAEIAAASNGAGNRAGRNSRVSRGLALIAAALTIPAGVAFAGDLANSSHDAVRDLMGNSVTVALADCPGMSAALADADIPPEPIILAECPTGSEIDSIVSDLELMEMRRSALESTR